MYTFAEKKYGVTLKQITKLRPSLAEKLKRFIWFGGWHIAIPANISNEDLAALFILIGQIKAQSREKPKPPHKTNQ